MSEQCEECKHIKELHIRLETKVEEHKRHFDEHKKHTAKRFEANESEVRQLKNITSNTALDIKSIKKDITTLTEIYQRSEKWQIDHEKIENEKMEKLSDKIDEKIDLVLKALKPVAEKTDKNSTFIYKLTVWATILSSVAGGLWWLHTKGYVSFGFAFTTAGG